MSVICTLCRVQLIIWELSSIELAAVPEAGIHEVGEKRGGSGNTAPFLALKIPS